ncbi:MAG: oligosaccharide flippase family protein [Clostridium sp.]|nr:oligosaccharide flippase family protein [Ruminococcus flavefaciens]MCM1500552.1 oligosaccharide flippase family protein [Clostridium sp.]
MKKKNAFLGTLFGIVYQIISILLAFGVRTVFLENLSVDYLGVNALFSDIFGILIALDCGISSSVFIRIYKPLADDDQERVKSVFALIRLVYRVRALAVFVVGGIIYFFLPVLAESETVPLEYIQRCYLIYLVLTAANYTIIFYTFFLETIQKRYILVIIQGTVQILQSLINIFCLFRFRTFLLYLTVNILAEILKGIISRQVGLNYFPYLKGKLRIEKEDKRDFKNLVGMAFHSMSNVAIRYTDSLLITGLVGLTVNGLYSNYRMIVEKISSLINQLTSSVKDPMRTLMAEGDKEKVKNTIEQINFLYFWISGFCAICLLTLLNPFIKLIWGEEYLLDYMPIVFTVLNLYLPILNYTVNDAYYYSECYRKDKRTPIAEILVNLVISVVLGRSLGLTGILIGTAACYLFQAVRRAYRLFHKYFGESVKKYVCRYAEYNVVIILAGVITFMAVQKVSLADMRVEFVVKCVHSTVIPNVIFAAIYYRSKRFQYFWSIVKDVWGKVKAKGR